MEKSLHQPFLAIWQYVVENSTRLAIVAIELTGVAFAAFLSWWIFKRVLKKLTPTLNKIQFLRRNPKVIELIRTAGGYIIIVTLGIISLSILKISVLEKFFYAGLVLLLASLINQFGLIVINYIQENVVDKTATKFDNIIVDLLNKFSGAVIYSVAAIMALDFLGVNVMPFIAGAGVASLAIGFAAKDTLSNLIAGVLLIIDRPFEIGDRIEVWNAPANCATWGDVIDIGLRATKIRTTDNIIIIIPNNEIMTRDIINYTTISQEIRVRIPIGVAYESDIDKAREVILGIIKEMDWISPYREPKVVVRNLSDFFVELQARVWIKDARKRMDTIDYVVDRVKGAFEASGIEIPYPKREVFVHTKARVENSSEEEKFKRKALAD